MNAIQAFNQNLLNLITHCYFDKDTDTLKRLRIPDEIAQKIATLPANVRHRLEKHKTPFIDLALNHSALNSAINNCTVSGHRESRYDKAILLGASKSTMHAVCAMSSQDFAFRRRALGITESRVRPKCLNEDEEIKLDGLLTTVDPDKDHLELLIELSEASKIEINRIYTYFVKTKSEVMQ